MKQINAKKILLISLFGALVALSGCQEKGPAEKAGENIDNMVDDSRDAIEDAADDVEDKTEELVDDVKDATN